MEAPGAADGERKTITALFADIKGSMELIEDLDPEEARHVVDPALQLMMDAVHRYEGYVAQSTGDDIFAFFGAPIAHEDHAPRALYAALRMQEEIKRYANTLRLEGRRPIEIRVGVNTGEVVVRSIRKDDLHADYVPIGHSTSLAARMESLATAGAIVVSEHTQKLTDGYFEFKALGAAKVKGVSEPVHLYEVLGVGPLRTRLQVAARQGLVKFVGRQNEMEQIRRALEQAKAGHGQIVGVMGEPGVGKSRLFYEFKLISQQGCLTLETFSVSHGKAYPYLPLIDLLKNYFHITPQDDERSRREKVTGRVLTLDRSLEDILPYLFALLGLADPISSLQQMDPQIRKRRTFEAIKRLLVRESLNQPLILIFEDLHWLDNETQAIMRGWALAEQGQGEEGVAQMRQGLVAWRAIEAEVSRPFGLALLAEAYGKVGQAAEGLSVLAEALAVVDKNGERMYEAELYQLKGQLTLQKFQVSSAKFQVTNPQSEAEECFLKAIEIARRQQAKSLELRAVMNLARLWQQQGKSEEARQMLAEIYDWFTEGFDTADLQEAKALLEKLNH